MLVLRALVAVCLLVGPVAAQKRAKPPAPRKPPVEQSAASVDPNAPLTIAAIKVSGNRNFTTEQVIAMSGLKPEQQVRKADFDEAQARLLESGLFETVAYRYDPIGNTRRYNATFTVKEIEQKLEAEYDRWLFERLRTELRSELQPRLAELIQRCDLRWRLKLVHQQRSTTGLRPERWRPRPSRRPLGLTPRRRW